MNFKIYIHLVFRNPANLSLIRINSPEDSLGLSIDDTDVVWQRGQLTPLPCSHVVPPISFSCLSELPGALTVLTCGWHSCFVLGVVHSPRLRMFKKILCLPCWVLNAGRLLTTPYAYYLFFVVVFCFLGFFSFFFFFLFFVFCTTTHVVDTCLHFINEA